jgi:hypothetical protein
MAARVRALHLNDENKGPAAGVNEYLFDIVRNNLWPRYMGTANGVVFELPGL